MYSSQLDILYYKMSNVEEEKWYVLNAIYGNSMNAKKELTKLNIPNFVPMESVATFVKGKKVKCKVQPIILNLVFVKSTFSRIKEINSRLNYLYFRYTKIFGEDKNVPLTVSDENMEKFISFIDGNEEHITYIQDTTTFNIKEGERVRITDGPFVGKEAIFVKIANVTKRQIVIEIGDILGATIKCQFPSRIIEKIK